MREIKFRGKNKDIGWVYGQLVYDENGNSYIVQDVEQDDSYGLEETMLYALMWYRVIPETVGQYTGLKDKNDIEIYDGDILGFYDLNDETIISKVYTFDDTQFCIDIENADYDVQTLAWAINDRIIWDIEVIGNIADNPELLKED